MIKYILFRLVLLIVIVGSVISYLAYLNGIDLNHIDFHRFLPRFSAPTLPEISDVKLPFGNEESQNGQSSSITKVYKWRGDDGVWHFSEQAPKDVTSAQAIFIDSNTNIIAADRLPEKPKTPMAQGGGKHAAQNNTQLNLNPYSQEAIKKLISDAKGVQQTLDERAKRLE